MSAGAVGIEAQVINFGRAVNPRTLYEELDRWAAHGQIELAADLEHGMEDGLGIEPLTVGTPEKRIVRVGFGVFRIVSDRLSVSGASDYQAMEFFERTTRLFFLTRNLSLPRGAGRCFGKEFSCQPVEQLWMTWRSSHSTKVTRGIYDATSEMIMPDPVDDGTPGEWVFRIAQPFRESRPAPAVFRHRFFAWLIGEVQREFRPIHTRQHTWLRLRSRSGDVAALEHMDGAASPGGFEGAI